MKTFLVYLITHMQNIWLHTQLFFRNLKCYLAVFLKIKLPLTRQHKIFNYTMYFIVELIKPKNNGT